MCAIVLGPARRGGGYCAPFSGGLSQPDACVRVYVPRQVCQDGDSASATGPPTFPQSWPADPCPAALSGSAADAECTSARVTDAFVVVPRTSWP